MNTHLVLFFAFVASASGLGAGEPCDPTAVPDWCTAPLTCNANGECAAATAGLKEGDPCDPTAVTDFCPAPLFCNKDKNGGECDQKVAGPGPKAPPPPPEVSCVDLHAPGRVSDCPSRKYLCDNKLYYDLMTIQCPLTCGRCPGQKRNNQNGNGNGVGGRPGNGNCVDLHAPGRVSDCPRRKYLCDNPQYKDLMTIQCPQTCGRC
ncbi:hypothetical protein QR680_004436 [Steinernema hermaphroditum]|uniref:ShKT domain-containing protein n=1 Tax=Steinernema hermaphroditum TaxID=289476 RepID=A0AA39HQ38_9BILA|nr:hypothetical protein QR680_004436 [Steinernema hermaphroditum]